MLNNSINIPAKSIIPSLTDMDIILGFNRAMISNATSPGYSGDQIRCLKSIPQLPTEQKASKVDLVHDDGYQSALTGTTTEGYSADKLQLNLKALNLETIFKEIEERKKPEVINIIEMCSSSDLNSLNQNHLKNKVHYLKNKNFRKKYLCRTNKSIKKLKSTFIADNKIAHFNNCMNENLILNRPLAISLESKEVSHALKVQKIDQKQFLDNSHTNRVFSELRFFLKIVFNLKFHKLPDIALDFNQLRIAAAIISKKFIVDFPIRSLYTIDNFNMLYTMKSAKRPEESYKFVFKHAYKYLKQKFKDNNMEFSKLGFNDLNLQFYKYYFQELSTKLGISINQFFLPLTPDAYCNKNQRVVAQTINVSYITLVCQSEHFMKDFLTYVNQEFLNNYAVMINNKVDNICEKWEQLFIETLGTDKTVSFICEYIHTNKKCKLPWTTKEVEFAIDIVNKLVHKCKRKTWVKSKNFERLILHEND